MAVALSKIGIHFFGVPRQFETYPSDKLDAYYQQFYDSQQVPWRFLIRQNNAIVHYIYIRYNLISANGRPGSLIGIALELEGVYFTTPRSEILNALSSIYDLLVNDKRVISTRGDGTTSFLITSFLEEQRYLNNLMIQLNNVMSKEYKEDLGGLKTNLDKIAASQIQQFVYLPKIHDDENILSSFFKYGGINIVPAEDHLIESHSTSNILSPSEQEVSWARTIHQYIDEQVEKRTSKIAEEALNQKDEKEKKINELQQQVRQLSTLDSSFPSKSEEQNEVRNPEEKVMQFTRGDANPVSRKKKTDRTSIVIVTLILIFIAIVVIKIVQSNTSTVTNNITSSSSSQTDTDSGEAMVTRDSTKSIGTIFDKKRTSLSDTGISSGSNTKMKAGKKSDKKPGTSKKAATSDLIGSVKYYINYEPLSKSKDEEFKRRAKNLKSSSEVEEMLQDHFNDSRAYGDDLDVSKMKTPSYKIATLLKNRPQNRDRINDVLKQITKHSENYDDIINKISANFKINAN